MAVLPQTKTWKAWNGGRLYAGGAVSALELIESYNPYAYKHPVAYAASWSTTYGACDLRSAACCLSLSVSRPRPTSQISIDGDVCGWWGCKRGSREEASVCLLTC